MIREWHYESTIFNLFNSIQLLDLCRPTWLRSSTRHWHGINATVEYLLKQISSSEKYEAKSDATENNLNITVSSSYLMPHAAASIKQ